MLLFRKKKSNSAYLTAAENFVLIGCQFLQSHGTARMEFIGTDSDLCPHTELTAIREPGGGIGINGGGVHIIEEVFQRFRIGSDNRIAVSGTVLIDVCDGILNRGNRFYRQDQGEIFRAPVIIRGRIESVCEARNSTPFSFIRAAKAGTKSLAIASWISTVSTALHTPGR